MMVKIICILSDDDGNEVQQFVVVEFKAAEVTDMGDNDAHSDQGRLSRD